MAREGEEQFQRIVSATRLHLPTDATEIPEATEQHLRNYVKSSQRLGVVAAIAVNAHEALVKQIAEEEAPGFRLHVLPVPCWGAFVPALNALLNFAQRCGAKYILYQSLEVRCTTAVLQRLLDHHTDDMLVVGPVFDGHDFQAGERLLNGRTTPWNTLALWSVRKLALTGFLCIADGLPDVPPSIGREGMQRVRDNPQEHSGDEDEDDDLLSPMGPMGSDDWWTRQMSAQVASSKSVPAGVEEVTAIALLQHLHGEDRARAALLDFSPDLKAQLSWSANWGKDERRAQWHQYKMASKVTRPAAQLQELFKFQKSSSAPQLSQLGNVSGKIACSFRRRGNSNDDLAGMDAGNSQSGDVAAPCVGTSGSMDTPEGTRSFGIVMHYGESIAPPLRVKWICLMSCLLFSMNSTAVLASAFRHINNSPANTSASTMAFASLLIGGVYVPMPLSLWLTRRITHRANHIAGLALFGSFLLLGHCGIVLAELLHSDSSWLLLARLVQGLGSGVLFQMRFVLASVSTSDLHTSFQSMIFLVSDLGLGLGTLLPAVTASLPGSGRLRTEMPELLPSLVLAAVSLAYVIWVLVAFPKRLPYLSDRVRFHRKADGQPYRSPSKEVDKSHRDRLIVWISGTTRVFVQSAILPTVALSMRDAQWTGNFRQTFAVAALCLLPMPFEAVASRLCCTCSVRARSEEGDFSKMASGAIGAVALAIASAAPRSLLGDDGDTTALIQRIGELATLMIALAMAAPFNATRLYQLKDAERAIVMLEWMKAYIGRLLGPLFAIIVYDTVGYGAVLSVLCTATVVVTLTA